LRERFSLKKLNEGEVQFRKLNEVAVNKKYLVEVSKMCAALDGLDAEVEINVISETITENINISAEASLGYYEQKLHKP
jgi:hypothetical protein